MSIADFATLKYLTKYTKMRWEIRHAKANMSKSNALTNNRILRYYLIIK